MDGGLPTIVRCRYIHHSDNLEHQWVSPPVTMLIFIFSIILSTANCKRYRWPLPKGRRYPLLGYGDSGSVHIHSSFEKDRTLMFGSFLPRKQVDVSQSPFVPIGGRSTTPAKMNCPSSIILTCKTRTCPYQGPISLCCSESSLNHHHLLKSLTCEIDIMTWIGRLCEHEVRRASLLISTCVGHHTPLRYPFWMTLDVHFLAESIARFSWLG
jgi:hypothetical protein